MKNSANNLEANRSTAREIKTWIVLSLVLHTSCINYKEEVVI